jgi:hypothetical protein
MSAVEAALAYITERGWAVFTVPATSVKVPHASCPQCRAGECAGMGVCGHRWCHGFYAATTDVDEIARRFEQCPRDLLAVRTGAASGLAVLDIDPRNDGFDSLVATHGQLPQTLSQMTGSNGIHLLYAHPGGYMGCKANSQLGAGIDVKADSGYIIVAPSRHPVTGTRYAWLNDLPLAPWPAHLTELLTPAPSPHRTRSTPGTPDGRLVGLVRKVLSAQDGERNSLLYWAACRAAEHDLADEMSFDVAAAALLHAAESIGTPTSEALRTIQSAYRGAA